MFRGFEIDLEAVKRLPGRSRDHAVAALRELDLKREQDPLSLYFPHQKQQVFHSFTEKVVCFFGGNQSGKTTSGLADDLIQALDRQDLPSHLLPYKRFEPPFLCRIMAPSFPVLETTLYQKIQELVPPHTLLGGKWSAAFDRNLRVLHFQNGSQFGFMTYEQDVSKMGGATLDRIHYDEEPPEAARNECRLRVMARDGDEIFSMTPVEGLTWTHNAFWKQRNEDDPRRDIYERPGLAIVTVDMDDNPALTEDAKERTLEGMSKAERTARKQGRFVALHGLIYGDFDRSRHVIPQIDSLPEHVNVVVGIDPGIRNRCAVVWGFLSHDDRLVIFEEGYYEGYTVAQVAKAVHEVNELYQVRPLYYVIDPAARNKEHQTGRSDQMEYADHGIVTIAGQNAVPAGINRIKERLESDRLHITANCVHLIEEFGEYRWKQPPRSGEDGPQKPVKKADHLLDAMRYLVMSRPYLPEHSPHFNETELERAMREDQERAVGEGRPKSEYGGVFV